MQTRTTAASLLLRRMWYAEEMKARGKNKGTEKDEDRKEIKYNQAKKRKAE